MLPLVRLATQVLLGSTIDDVLKATSNPCGLSTLYRRIAAKRSGVERRHRSAVVGGAPEEDEDGGRAASAAALLDPPASSCAGDPPQSPAPPGQAEATTTAGAMASRQTAKVSAWSSRGARPPRSSFAAPRPLHTPLLAAAQNPRGHSHPGPDHRKGVRAGGGRGDARGVRLAVRAVPGAVPTLDGWMGEGGGGRIT